MFWFKYFVILCVPGETVNFNNYQNPAWNMNVSWLKYCL